MTQVNAPNTGVVGSSYNARGERTMLTYPDSTAVGSSYWADGQLRDVTQGATTLASYAYDSQGRLQSLTRSNGATTSLSYDAADRLRDLHTTVGSTTRSRFQYTVDRLGQRTQATETFPLATRTIAYGYDGLQRLTSAVESPGTSYGYSYDLAGNRTSVTVNGVTTESRTYDAANQVSNTGWLYDAAGNLLTDGSAVSTYDAFNRPLTVVAGLQARVNTYNGDGVLVSQISNSLLTRYTQDLATPLSQILQTSQLAGVTTNHIYGLDRLASVTAGVRTWQIGDALGSVRQTLSDLGVSLTTANYDPWGTPQTGTLPTTFGFTGELQDASTGLVYLRARWYSTGQGRFVSRDPFEGVPEQPYSLHSYAYALSNPVRWTDPSGKCAEGDGDNLDTCKSLRGILLSQYGLETTNLSEWKLDHLKVVQAGANKLIARAGWTLPSFRRAITGGHSTIKIERERISSLNEYNAAETYSDRIIFYDETFYANGKFWREKGIKVTIHELAHAWDNAAGNILSNNMAAAAGSARVCYRLCGFGPILYRTCSYAPGGGPAGNETPSSAYGKTNEREDWADAVAAVVYPDWFEFKDTVGNSWVDTSASTTRRNYGIEQFRLYR